MNKVTIRLRNIEDDVETKEIDLEDIIFNQSDIEFEFADGGTLPYKDFLWFRDEYEVIVKIKGEK